MVGNENVARRKGLIGVLRWLVVKSADFLKNIPTTFLKIVISGIPLIIPEVPKFNSLVDDLSISSSSPVPILIILTYQTPGTYPDKLSKVVSRQQR